MAEVYKESSPHMDIGHDPGKLSQLLKELSSNLREKRFNELFETSEGILEDT
ncbi:MAG: hypothetical protein ABEJ99_04975 [Candidatus Nanohaloarchaea archaeon]